MQKLLARLATELDSARDEMMALARRGKISPARKMDAALPPAPEPPIIPIAPGQTAEAIQPADRIIQGTLPRNDLPGTTSTKKAGPDQALPAMKRLGDVLFVISPTGDKVSAASLDGNKLKSVQLSYPGDPPKEVFLSFIPFEDLPKGYSPYVTLIQKGGKVHRLAIFILKELRWRTVDLPEPVTNATAIVKPDFVFFQLDERAVAAYSLPANRWDLLKFETPSDDLSFSTEGNISIVTRPGHIYRYDSLIGRWSDLDTRALLNQPDRDSAAAPDKEPAKSEPR
jgi:hypothetical protein